MAETVACKVHALYVSLDSTPLVACIACPMLYVYLKSAGCILGELYAGKPIMPGRTEVEQPHKIFKLCGSPSHDYWTKSKLPHSTVFKQSQPYKRCIVEAFKDFPPANLPQYLPTKKLTRKRETMKLKVCSGLLDVRLWLIEFSDFCRQRAAGSKGPKETRAVPVPDANVKLVTSIQAGTCKFTEKASQVKAWSDSVVYSDSFGYCESLVHYKINVACFYISFHLTYHHFLKHNTKRPLNPNILFLVLKHYVMPYYTETSLYLKIS
ncbi:putative serine/threonine-protein kinase [Artemisia annua]|uniref:Putative serine/threonine-protein kinase n=1 Tax=Artemisia annua TaxID=35608 RepID=A0A2U1PET1_ARTAN|nr:putative serine/threonine-protein kinase [Artemisia annua]